MGTNPLTKEQLFNKIKEQVQNKFDEEQQRLLSERKEQLKPIIFKKLIIFSGLCFLLILTCFMLVSHFVIIDHKTFETVLQVVAIFCFVFYMFLFDVVQRIYLKKKIKKIPKQELTDDQLNNRINAVIKGELLSLPNDILEMTSLFKEMNERLDILKDMNKEYETNLM